jgi:hypothetical protein
LTTEIALTHLPASSSAVRFGFESFLSAAFFSKKKAAQILPNEQNFSCGDHPVFTSPTR